MRRILLIIFIIPLFQNCATFKETKIQGTLNKDNLSELNGTYNISPDSGGGFYVRYLNDVFDRNTCMFNFKHDNKYKYNNQDVKYINENIVVDINVISNKYLNIKFKNGNQIVSDKNVKVKLKKDGYLYIKEKKLAIEGIPLVLGGWDIQKSRLTINSDGNLFIESNYFYCNGFIVIVCYLDTFNYELMFLKR